MVNLARQEPSKRRQSLLRRPDGQKARISYPLLSPATAGICLLSQPHCGTLSLTSARQLRAHRSTDVLEVHTPKLSHCNRRRFIFFGFRNRPEFPSHVLYEPRRLQSILWVYSDWIFILRRLWKLRFESMMETCLGIQWRHPNVGARLCCKTAIMQSCGPMKSRCHLDNWQQIHKQRFTTILGTSTSSDLSSLLLGFFAS